MSKVENHKAEKRKVETVKVETIKGSRTEKWRVVRDVCSHPMTSALSFLELGQYAQRLVH